MCLPAFSGVDLSVATATLARDSFIDSGHTVPPSTALPVSLTTLVLAGCVGFALLLRCLPDGSKCCPEGTNVSVVGFVVPVMTEPVGFCLQLTCSGNDGVFAGVEIVGCESSECLCKGTELGLDGFSVLGCEGIGRWPPI